MSRTRDLADLLKNSGVAIPPIVAGKNFFINGGFDHWQRGTSFTAPNGAYTADRFKVTVNGAATYVVSRQASGLSETQYCLRFQRSSGQTYTHGSFVGYAWETEAMQSLQGKTVTYSFYARVGANWSPLGGIGVQLQQGTGSGTHAFSGLTGETSVFNGTASSLTTTWQRFSFTGTVSSTATELRTNLSFSPTGTAGANDYIEFAGFQLEVGSVATPFSRAGGRVGAELALCQRYYQRYKADSVFDDLGYSGKAVNSTEIYGSRIPFVPFRVGPTSVDFANVTYIPSWGAGTTAVSNITIASYSSADSPLLIFTTTGVSTGTIYYLLAGNTTNAYLGLSAEL